MAGQPRGNAASYSPVTQTSWRRWASSSTLRISPQPSACVGSGMGSAVGSDVGWRGY